MKTTIQVKNILCGSCSNFVHKSMNHLPGVFGMQINLETGVVTIEHTDEVTRQQLVDQLASLGYAEVTEEKKQ